MPPRRPTIFLASSALALVLCALAPAPGSAAEAPAVPVPPPLPPERPSELKPAQPAEQKPAPTAESGKPTPPARPAEPTPPAKDGAAEAQKPGMPVPPPTPPERPPELSGEAALALKVSPPDDTACRVRLKRLGVEFEPLPPIAEGQCTAPLPLKVTKLADGIALPGGATLTCQVAESFARWATEVQVAADRTLKHPLTGSNSAAPMSAGGRTTMSMPSSATTPSRRPST